MLLLWFCNSWRSNGIPCCSIEIYPTYQLYGELFTQDESSALQPAVPYNPSLSNRRIVSVLNVHLNQFFFCAFQPKFRQEGHSERFWITSVVSRVCYLYTLYSLTSFSCFFVSNVFSKLNNENITFLFFSLHVIVSVFACYN